jgi:type II secretory pathway pseudopilin PulG
VSRQRAFTLVEALVAFLVSTVVTWILLDLYQGGVRGLEVDTWHASANVRLRNALRMLREDLTVAGAPWTITAVNATVDPSDRYWVRYRAGRTTASGAETGEGTVVLSFHITDADRTTAVGGDHEPGYVVQATLDVRGRTLHYSRTAVAGRPPPHLLVDRTIVTDLESIDTSVEPLGLSNGATGILRLEVRARHPGRPQSAVVQQTAAVLRVPSREL